MATYVFDSWNFPDSHLTPELLSMQQYQFDRSVLCLDEEIYPPQIAAPGQGFACTQGAFGIDAEQCYSPDAIRALRLLRI